MSDDRFQIVVREVFGVEGGYSDRKKDKGGPTNMGITYLTLAEAQRRGLVPREVNPRTLTREQAERIYYELYWKAYRCPEFPAPLDLCAFDAFVNHRPRPAARIFQEAVGAVPDGVIGDATVRAANAVELVGAVERYARVREAFYRQIVKDDPTQQEFIRGWLNRLAHVRAAALKELAA